MKDIPSRLVALPTVSRDTSRPPTDWVGAFRAGLEVPEPLVTHLAA